MPTFELWGKLTQDIVLEVTADNKSAALAQLLKLSESDIMKQGRIRSRKDITWNLDDIWTVAIDNSIQ